jgi:hypothetical protein
MSLSIVSWGGVTPGGFGTKGIVSPWPSATAISGGGRELPVALVDRHAPELVRWEKEPRLRRASPITYYMIEAVHQALETAPQISRARTGIIATFFLGCLVYSVRFYRQITEEGRRFGSPVLFPETVFNSPLSHVVATLGLGGPVYSQIGDKSCWVTGLRTAECWLRNGDADHVIVLGAEEFEPHALDALRAGGLLREKISTAEGAVALLLGQSRGRARISRIADGFSFNSPKDAQRAAAECLGAFSQDVPLLETATGWTKPVARKSAGSRRTIRQYSASTEGFTVSAARDTIQAAHLIGAGSEDEIIVPVWGLTNQLAALLVTRPDGA